MWWIVAIFVAIVTALVWHNYAFAEYYPHKLLDGCPQLPISESEQARGVVAKFEIKGDQVSDLLEWYRSRGFSTAADSTQTNGYGPHGLSFVMSVTNRVLTLVVTQWKDF
jgi:hypothetical protein